MSDTEISKGDGLGSSVARSFCSDPAWVPPELQSLGDHGRHIQHEAEALGTAVWNATDEAQRYLTDQMRQRPLAIVGVAAGIGYVLGRGFSARLAFLVLGTAARVATTAVARELGARVLRRGLTAVPNVRT